MSPKEGKFVLSNTVSLSQFKGSLRELQESDLCLQDADTIYQFKYEEPDEEEKSVIEPGTFSLAETSGGIKLEPIVLKNRSLLETASSTARIFLEAKTFFSKLHIYEQLNRPKKRGVLLYSKPGLGKTSAIERVCKDFVTEDPGTVVMIWPTSQVDADTIVRFLSSTSEYDPKCTRLLLVIEDIGGGEREGHHSNSAVESGLLNLLDGVGEVFKLPTFIIATTNHPESLLESLADRPGRFDLMLQLQSPSAEERLQLMEFIAKRPLTDSEKTAVTKRGTDGFSIAHLEEIVVRSMLHDKTYNQVVDELIEHQLKFQKDFEEREKTISF